MRYYEFNYTALSDGTVYMQWRDHNDDDNRSRPTYQALRKDIASDIAYADKLNATIEEA